MGGAWVRVAVGSGAMVTEGGGSVAEGTTMAVGGAEVAVAEGGACVAVALASGGWVTVAAGARAVNVAAAACRTAT